MITGYTVPEIWCVMDVTAIFHFGLFFTLLPPNSPKNENFEKNKKNTYIYHHFTHKSHKNHDHMLYCSWDMARDTCNFISISCYFLPFYPLTAQRIKISKKREKYLEILPFYTCVPKIMIKWCTIPEIWFATNGRTDRQRDGLTDGQMDGQMEKMTHRGGCPPKSQAKIKYFLLEVSNDV